MEENIRSVPGAALITGILTVLTVLFIILPVTFPFSLIAFSLAAAVVFAVFGLYRTFGFIVFTGIAAALVSTAATALFLLAVGAPFGVCIGAAFRYGWSLKKMLAVTVGYMTVVMTAFFVILYVTMGFNLFAVTRESLAAAFEQALQNATAAGVSDLEIMNVKYNIVALTDVIPLMIPSALVIAVAVMTYAEAKLTRLLLNFSGLEVAPLLPIRYWEMGRPVLYLYVLAQIMQYWGTTREIMLLNGCGINLDNLMFFLISPNGLAVIFFFLQRRFIMSTFSQGILIFVYWFLPVPTQYITFLAGIADIIFTYRRKYRVN